MAIKDDLQSIVGAESVSDAPELLERYALDYSLVQPRAPSVVVFAAGTPQVQAILRYANERSIAVTPRSSSVGFHGAGIPAEGGIVLDLTRMNRILEVDLRNRNVKVQPGVTWSQVQNELGKQGMMVCPPLLPHPAKSVLTSATEREPILIPKSEYSEVLLTAELVLANGDLFWTGTALARGMKGQVFPDGLIPGTRLFLGSQGCLGIMTWAKLKTEYIPSLDRLFFLPFRRVEDIVEPLYRIERRMIGSECFALNSTCLGRILAEKWPGDFNRLREALPPWVGVLVLSGMNRLPEQRIAYEELALRDIAGELRFEFSLDLPRARGLDRKLLALLRRPWESVPYWKFRNLGRCQEVFFYVTLDRAAEITRGIEGLAVEHGYPLADLDVYLQPVERARVVYVSYGFHYDPADAQEAERVRALHLAASEFAMNKGGLFATPYGPWADMVYSRAATYTATMKVVKQAFDPNNILNPGKLCF